MAEKRLLVIGHDREQVDWVLGEVEPGGGRSFCRGAEVGAVAGTLSAGDYALAIYCRTRGEHLDEISRVLWLCSAARRPIPLIVVADEYHEGQALTLFRMGVTDYLSRRDHRGRIAWVVARLLGKELDIDPAEPFPRPPRSRIKSVGTF
jgi:hypothetical protein